MNIKTVPAKNNNNNITLRKSPLTQLKQDLERLRQQLNSNHIDHLNKLKLDHKQELTHLKKKKKPSCHLNNLDHILEQALLEFEQEQYNHIPTTMLIRQHDSNHKSLLHGKTIPAMMNQQWYSKKFIPVDAVSWPAPQPSPNLKIMRNHSR
ncbi:hypothetical protein EDC94DRAFT_517139 [Helicostylum pulchrum]|nr:hypothetical protein EDC94DRAFT_517139 [Helicostylum pulchrum]